MTAEPSCRVAVLGLGIEPGDELRVVLQSRYEVTTAPDVAGLSQADIAVLEARRCGQPLLDQVTQARRAVGEGDGRVVVVCERIGSSDARMLLVAGASGLVITRDLGPALIPTIEAVRAGQVCLPPRHAGTAQPPGLSGRERQIVGLVALGLSNKEIAERLFLAESTIKSHLNSAFGKLGVSSRTEAVDLIVNPAFGLASGIMSLGAEPITSGDA
jgi:DNA-binding NarL/FixJ family response regulator